MKTMPALFVGHGSPMIAIDDNNITHKISEIGKQIIRDYGQPKAIACGEFGLDYHYGASTKAAQRTLFEKQIEIGIEKKKPLVLHLREAEKDRKSVV